MKALIALMACVVRPAFCDTGKYHETHNQAVFGCYRHTARQLHLDVQDRNPLNIDPENMLLLITCSSAFMEAQL